jgi:hypothetical protein
VSDPTAAELRAAVDEVAIRGLIAAYADVVNRRAWPELSELFVPDASIELDLRSSPPMRFAGPIEIGEFIAGAIERFLFFEFVALNMRVVRAADPDRARVRTYMCELRQDRDGIPSRAFGLYQDDVVRAADGWRFAARHYQSIARGERGLDLMPSPEIL